MGTRVQGGSLSKGAHPPNSSKRSSYPQSPEIAPSWVPSRREPGLPRYSSPTLSSPVHPPGLDVLQALDQPSCSLEWGHLPPRPICPLPSQITDVQPRPCTHTTSLGTQSVPHSGAWTECPPWGRREPPAWQAGSLGSILLRVDLCRAQSLSKDST